jgi:hypothetical protein
VEDYYRILKTECVPIGHAVNANIAMVTGFSVHADAEEAKRRGEDGFKFFGYALGHHYIFGEHKPGHTDIWAAYEIFSLFGRKLEHWHPRMRRRKRHR